jgi:hypothetical protein
MQIRHITGQNCDCRVLACCDDDSLQYDGLMHLVRSTIKFSSEPDKFLKHLVIDTQTAHNIKARVTFNVAVSQSSSWDNQDTFERLTILLELCRKSGTDGLGKVVIVIRNMESLFTCAYGALKALNRYDVSSIKIFCHDIDMRGKKVVFGLDNLRLILDEFTAGRTLDLTPKFQQILHTVAKNMSDKTMVYNVPPGSNWNRLMIRNRAAESATTGWICKYCSQDFKLKVRCTDHEWIVHENTELNLRFLDLLGGLFPELAAKAEKWRSLGRDDDLEFSEKDDLEDLDVPEEYSQARNGRDDDDDLVEPEEVQLMMSW